MIKTLEIDFVFEQGICQTVVFFIYIIIKIFKYIYAQLKVFIGITTIKPFF